MCRIQSTSREDLQHLLLDVVKENNVKAENMKKEAGPAAASRTVDVLLQRLVLLHITRRTGGNVEENHTEAASVGLEAGAPQLIPGLTRTRKVAAKFDAVAPKAPDENIPGVLLS